ncbi:sugar ABC transporter permease [Bacilli bacterium]|nr:sugar ABC transporter permease [Bacilli bacterium]
MRGTLFFKRLNSFLIHLLFFVIIIIMALPLLWALMLSFKTNAGLYANPLALPEVWNFNNYARALKTINLALLYGNTFYVLIFSVGISIVITFMSSYALSRMYFKRRIVQKQLYNYLILGLMIPPFILLFPIYRIGVGMQLHQTRIPLILAYIATNISFDTLLFTNFFKSLPGEIEEAALIDGCTLPQLCIRIIAPIAKSVIATVLIFNTLYVWNEFPFASILLSSNAMYTLSLGASFFKGLYSVDNTGIIASSFLIIIPQLIFYAFFQRYIVTGMTAGAVKG